jgi:hypothetical protein
MGSIARNATGAPTVQRGYPVHGCKRNCITSLDEASVRYSYTIESSMVDDAGANTE